MEALIEVECPRCVTTQDIGIDLGEIPTLTPGGSNLVEGSRDYVCGGCGAKLRLEFSAQISSDVEDITVVKVPTARFDCPRCGDEIDYDEIESESGREEVQCEACRTWLELEWWDWGQVSEVGVDESA